MTAYVATCTGWEWDHIENTMTIPRMKALEKFWETTPPNAVSNSVTAQANGMKLKKKGKQISVQELVKGLDNGK